MTGTTTLGAAEMMQQSLDAASERDIVPDYFARFFAAHPQEEANFHNKISSQGTMVNEMITYLLALAEGEEWVPMMMRSQVMTHHDHGDIALQRYRDSLDLLIAVLADAAGTAWQADWEHAWREQADRLYAVIERCY